MIERLESRRMVRMFAAMTDLADAANAHVSFEWPWHCHDWKTLEVVSLHRTLRVSAALDGCACGLTDAAGNPVKKPWRCFWGVFPRVQIVR